MTYFLQDLKKIVLVDENKERLEQTLFFMPQYSELEIQETEKEIVNFNGEFYFADDKEYISKKEALENERIANLSLTKREVFLAIYQDKGIIPEQIRGKISDSAALIEFDYAEKYYRGNPLIDILGQELGYTKENLDYLFENKKFPAESVGDLSVV